MQLPNYFKKITPLLYRFSAGIVGLLIACYVAAMGYYVYTTIYRVSINPVPIASSEIVAKKQKVNLELFNTINQTVLKKKVSTSDQLLKLRNPFSSQQ